MDRATRRRSTCCLLTMLVTLGSAASAPAEPQFLTTFTARYPSATRLDTCGTCHNNFSSNSPRNAYGLAFQGAGGTTDQKLAAIESLDSDGDGTLNLTEIMTGAGFMPGIDCDTIANAINAPANLADYVDPNDVGCVGVVTTVTSSSSSTSSTTLPVTAACAQPVSSGPAPVATDCLYILQVATALRTCTPACVCAPKGTLPASATDALICLQKATGIAATLNCPCP